MKHPTTTGHEPVGQTHEVSTNTEFLEAAFIRVEHQDDGTEIFRPTGICRGPWNLDHCHAGPPTALLARAVEQLLPAQRLVRLTVELTRPVPMAGFTIEANTTRSGRTVSTATARIVDLDGRQIAVANSSHLTPQPTDEHMPTATIATPDPAESNSGDFPLASTRHGAVGFTDGTTISYPSGEDRMPGPTTLWMTTAPIVEGELPTPFQRICPLADCGNAVSRNAEPDQFGFVNTDLTIYLHREPIGDMLGTRAVSHWNSDGVGMSDALLFDGTGPVGRAVQTLLVNRT